ncbi:hypothetical protein CDAR_276011 [Caerostris darwini]|uniref:Uncharacterized protein n=1 Tax=Caerostris darwini TaxID=1538125 RepID=A0AAV4QLT1_9ARAC|nr:hypothetical protein CDAR_276011 [Caerostris darwini]
MYHIAINTPFNQVPGDVEAVHAKDFAGSDGASLADKKEIKVVRIIAFETKEQYFTSYLESSNGIGMKQLELEIEGRFKKQSNRYLDKCLLPV